jgi:hypothetical protein
MMVQASRMRRLQPTLSIRNTMIDHQIGHILARLEVGLRTDSARLKALEADLAINLQRMRSFGTEQDSLPAALIVSRPAQKPVQQGNSSRGAPASRRLRPASCRARSFASEL